MSSVCLMAEVLPNNTEHFNVSHLYMTDVTHQAIKGCWSTEHEVMHQLFLQVGGKKRGVLSILLFSDLDITAIK